MNSQRYCLVRFGAVVSLLLLLSCVVTHAQELSSPLGTSTIDATHYGKRPLSMTATRSGYKHFAGECIAGPVQGMCGSGRRKTLLFLETLTNHDAAQRSHPKYMLIKGRSAQTLCPTLQCADRKTRPERSRAR
jgi:hypothetical protein